MRLSETQVKLICQKVLQTLASHHLVSLKRSETEVLAKMQEIFITDLKVEDQVNREADKLLEQVAGKMGGNVDREKLFQMIKKQLIKDKNIII